VSGFLACHARDRKKPVGPRFPSERQKPCGSFETGRPAETMPGKPGYSRLVCPGRLTDEPVKTTCIDRLGQRVKPSHAHKLRFVLLLRPYDDMGMHGKKPIHTVVMRLPKKLTGLHQRWCAKMPGRSQNGCFGGTLSRTTPKDVEKSNKYNKLLFF